MDGAVEHRHQPRGSRGLSAGVVQVASPSNVQSVLWRTHVGCVCFILIRLTRLIFSANHDRDDMVLAMVPAVHRYVCRDTGIGGRLPAETLAVTAVKTGAIGDKIEDDLWGDGPCGSMAPMAEERGQRSHAKGGVCGRGEGAAGFGGGMSAAMGAKKKLPEPSGSKVGCLPELGAMPGRRGTVSGGNRGRLDTEWKRWSMRRQRRRQAARRHKKLDHWGHRQLQKSRSRRERPTAGRQRR